MEMLWDSRVSDLETQVRDGPEKEGRHGKQEYEDLEKKVMMKMKEERRECQTEGSEGTGCN